MGIVYRATSMSTRKSYIGVTIKSLYHRQQAHFSDARIGRDTLFCNALRKYSQDDFVWDILVSLDNVDDLYEEEKWFIANYNTQVPDGYNTQEGGNKPPDTTGRKHTKETRIKLSKSMQGNTNFAGYSHSKETRLKLAKSHGYAVRCFNNRKVYPSILQAYLDTGTNDRYIRDCCNNDWIRDPGHSDWKFEWANKSEVNVEIIPREERRRIK